MLSVFLGNIAVAQQMGEEWVETTPEIIQHFNPKGMGINPLTEKPNRFFIYHGIKVCPKGERESIENEMDQPLSQRIHGEKEGVIETSGGTAAS